MTYDEIRQAVAQHLVDWSTVNPNVTINYENRKTISNPNGVWIRLTIAYANNTTSEISNKPASRKHGKIIFQIFDQEENGSARSMQTMDSLSDQYQYWQSGTLQCLTGSVVNQEPVNGYYQTNLEINFYAD